MLYLDEKHNYFWDGKKLPSITQIVCKNVLIKNTTALENGQSKHSELELAALGLFESEIFNIVKEKLKIKNIIGIELKITNGEVAGTIDLLCNNNKNEYVIIDWKTGKKYSWHKAQLGGYAYILEKELCSGLSVKECLLYDVYVDSVDIVKHHYYDALYKFREALKTFKEA